MVSFEPLQVSEWRDLPLPRVHGVALIGEHQVVGGLAGLYRMDGRTWQRLDERPVKDMTSDGTQIWVLYGDGSVDKLAVSTGRLYFDVLAQAAKRPWSSSMAQSGGQTLFGGHGGWISKSKNSFAQRYPAEIAGDVVTCLAITESGLWVGTQRHGFYLARGKAMSHFGFAKGLPDTWVTSLLPTHSSTVIGLAEAGIMKLTDGELRKLECPVRRVRKLALFRGRLVVGGMDGVVIQSKSGWDRLTEEECTCLTVAAGQLVIGNPGRTLVAH